MTRAINITGQRFGRIVVLNESGRAKDGSILWECRCDCGNKTIIAGYKLRNGHSQSCGCLQKEKAREANMKHGESKTRLYRIWNALIQRCTSPKSVNYKDYGGRGIEVCPEWRDNFEAFRDWAMANGYQDGLTIDRIDVNGNYEPSNCRWATSLEQNNNARFNHYIEHNGEKHTIAEWSRITGISQKAIYGRLKRGWSTENILTIQTNRRNSHGK